MTDDRPAVLFDAVRSEFETRLRQQQRDGYTLAEPKLMPKGSRIECVAHFDNSAENPANPDPKATVTWGPQTWDEMMIGFFDIAVDPPALWEEQRQRFWLDGAPKVACRKQC